MTGGGEHQVQGTVGEPESKLVQVSWEEFTFTEKNCLHEKLLCHTVLSTHT